ncbi:MAG: hypothetical protein IT372_07785 [Polyangiaceae bacterium]|nr:hypothetical protein [Polyangiaceae bacterium]
MTRIAPIAALALALLSICGAAAAEEKKPLEIKVVIQQRVPRPMAAIDVGRIAPKLGVADLRRSAVDRIEQAVSKEPF